MDTPHAEEIPVSESAEVAPGVIVERRSFLALAASALGITGLSGCSGKPVHAGSGGQFSMQEFVDEVVPVAKQLKESKSPWGEDRYLYTLASYAVRLGKIKSPQMSASDQGVDTFVGKGWGSDPFTVFHWRMAPGSVIRPHAHTYDNVVTLVLDGQARIRSFETVEKPEFWKEDLVRVRMTNDQLLAKGDINIVHQAQAHEFRAGPAGAQGIDISTPLRKMQPTPYLELQKKPVDAQNRIFMGSWKV